ncbi:MAG TPA: putative peptidoglycan glycosyltransferase FtsW [Bacteroidales bacterium]|nr:putative peptidoglycan glycosyltransferase FtsW [Bacteroidales bacterium]HPS16392.1 putative peptidoglycan glycosyltransferase FtsW [Bacteroidales bacterium]
MIKILNNIRGDKIVWLVIFILTIFSLLSVYSSTGTLAYRYQHGNTEYYLIKHFIILLFGLGLMYVAHLVKYTYYSRISQLAMFIAVPLLLFTLFTGTNVNEASRWLTLPVINLTFQSSDFAKLALIIYVARLLSKKQEQIKDFKSAFVPIMAPILIVCGLILPANFSTAAVLFATCMTMMFIGRINMKYIFALFGIAVVLFSLFVIILMNSQSQGRLGTWKNRIENFQNPDKDENYQVEQGKIAIATGGIVGKFPGNSTQRNFLPHPYSDFIYAIIVEEYGLIGAIVVILMYLILLFRGVKIASTAPGTFGAFLAFGCCFSLVFQAFINMAVAVNLFPVTGQPLPMVSMGGTSIWFTGIAIGIILSVSKESDKEKKSGKENTEENIQEKNEEQ